jgi:protein-L-isoaspartate O-methyltransferase
LNNRELLIHILLELRSSGIKNQSILKIIESIPPHYYLSFYQKKKDFKLNSTINELIQIVKILELAFFKNIKYENILIVGIKKGWLLTLASKLCKRAYSICDNLSQKKKLENLFYSNNFKNIYLKSGKDFSAWKSVSPFDVIIYLKKNKFIPDVFQDYLSKNGIALFPNVLKDNNINLVKVNKELERSNTVIEYKFLEQSDLI